MAKKGFISLQFKEILQKISTMSTHFRKGFQKPYEMVCFSWSLKTDVWPNQWLKRHGVLLRLLNDLYATFVLFKLLLLTKFKSVWVRCSFLYIVQMVLFCCGTIHSFDLGSHTSAVCYFACTWNLNNKTFIRECMLSEFVWNHVCFNDN